ncbi:MAG: carboxylating nicotinate-nucleotide diphosphorylase, partial [Planctomycetota bacterium]
TSDILPPNVHATGRFVARQAMVFCGGKLLAPIAACYDDQLRTEVCSEEGQRVQPGDTLAVWHGPARSMLTAERVALNFLQRLCGVATLTARYVAKAHGTPAKICDTRKTTPGWRELEKYAVRAGGGTNHRRGLYDAILIKDNHLAILAAAGHPDPIVALPETIATLREKHPDLQFVQIEVDTLDQLETALTLDVEMILLDNMNPSQLRRAVEMRARAGKADAIELEASGGITLSTVADVAATGVDRISVGAVTHSAVAVDIGLDVRIG